MARLTILVMSLALLCFPAGAFGQMHGQGGQHMMGQGMGHGMMSQGLMDNMGMMTHMMGQMHEMVAQGKMTPEQHQQMLDMMGQMGQMLQQMRSPQSPQGEQQQKQQLQEMQQRLNSMQGPAPHKQ